MPTRLEGFRQRVEGDIGQSRRADPNERNHFHARCRPNGLVAGSHVLELKEKFMFNHISRSLVALALISAAALPARAQLAVIDIPAIVQLIQEVQTMQQQVQTAEAQLAQAKQALQTMTGDRGMQLLLNGISRN